MCVPGPPATNAGEFVLIDIGALENRTATHMNKFAQAAARARPASTWSLPFLCVCVRRVSLSDLTERGCVGTGGGVTNARKDLSEWRAALGNNFRFVADTYMLQLGIKQFVYLDADTCVNYNLASLLGTSKTAPVVVAKRSRQAQEAVWNSWSGTPKKVLEILKVKWGFEPKFHQFNAGVMLVNTEAYCDANIFETMRQVASLHAKRPFFQMLHGLNQPYAEVANARTMHRVPEYWNCRREFQPLVTIDGNETPPRAVGAAPKNYSDICPKPRDRSATYWKAHSGTLDCRVTHAQPYDVIVDRPHASRRRQRRADAVIANTRSKTGGGGPGGRRGIQKF